MHWLDVGIYIVLLSAVVSGAWVGAVRRVLTLLALLVAFSEAWRIAPWVYGTVLPYLDVAPTAFSGLLVPVLSFLLLFGVLYLLGRVVASFFGGGVLGVANRLLGAALGLVLAIYSLGYAFSLFDAVVPIRSPQAEEPEALIDARLKSHLYAPIRGSITDLPHIKAYLMELRSGLSDAD